MAWAVSMKTLSVTKECSRMVLWMELGLNVAKENIVSGNLPMEI